MEETKLYIANLAQYNSGNNMGRWFKLPVSMNIIKEILRLDGSNEYGEEWIILDWENPYCLPIGEYSNIDQLNEYVNGLEELEDNVLANLATILSFGSESIDDILGNGGENYKFTGKTDMEDVAREVVESAGDLENVVVKNMQIIYYIDYSRLGHDLEISGSYFEGKNGEMIEYIG